MKERTSNLVNPFLKTLAHLGHLRTLEDLIANVLKPALDNQKDAARIPSDYTTAQRLHNKMADFEEERTRANTLGMIPSGLWSGPILREALFSFIGKVLSSKPRKHLDERACL